MSKINVTVSVEQSGYLIMKAITGLAGAVKSATKTGHTFQSGQDLPLIVAEALKDLPVIMAQLAAVSGDVAEDKKAFIKGINLGTWELVDEILS